MRFFKIPIHYLNDRKIYSVSGTTRTDTPQVNDNDYRTGSNSTTYIVETHGDTLTTNTIVNYICVKVSNIDRYSVSVPDGHGMGAGFTNRVIPTTVTPASSFAPQMTSTTIHGIQYDLVSLSPESPVVTDALLSGSTATIANNLSSIPTPVVLKASLTDAVLTAAATPGTVEIVGENPAGTAVRQTLSFANNVLTAPQTTTQTYLNLTAVNLTGFMAGTLNITFDSTLSCTEVQLSFSGTDPRVIEIMLLEELLYFPPFGSFKFINHTQEPNSIPWTSLSGQNRSRKSLASRTKWVSRYMAEFTDDSAVNYNDFLRLRNENRFFVFEQEYERYPDRVYPARWGNLFTDRYRTSDITQGINAEFVIEER